MGSRKYANDYRLENQVDLSGRIRTVPVYVAGYYRLISGADEIRKMRRVYPILSGLIWIGLVLPLFLSSQAGRTMYVALPHAFCLFPALFFAMGVFQFCTMKEDLTREFSDKLNARLSGGALITMILSGLTLIGFVVMCWLDGDLLRYPADIIFGLGIALSFAASLYAFLRRKVSESKKAE